MKKKKSLGKKIFTNLLYVFVLGFFVWVVYQNLDDFKTLYDTIFSANLVFLGYALLLGLGNQVIFSFIYRKSFKIISNNDDYPLLLPNTIISNFLSISNPLGVTGGGAYLLRYFTRRKVSPIKTMFGMLTTSLSISISYFAVLAVTVIYLYNTHNLHSYQRLAIQLIILLNVGMIALYAILLVTPSMNAKIARTVTKYINSITRRILKKDVVKNELIKSYEKEIRGISKRFDKSIVKFFRYIPLSFIYHGFNILILFLTFLAFDTVAPLQQVMAVYGIIFLFSVISPTPQGIGIVEGLAQASAVSVGLPKSASLLAILMYRVAVLWTPALLGLVLMRKNEKDLSDSQ